MKEEENSKANLNVKFKLNRESHAYNYWLIFKIFYFSNFNLKC